jgi:dsRNA-specific ribonuclease
MDNLETTLPYSIIRDGIEIVKPDGSTENIPVPYNEKNILVSEDDIKNILSNHGVYIDKVNDIELFRQALTHKSYLRNKNFTNDILTQAKLELGNPSDLVELRTKDYNILEYIGDRFLKLTIASYLYKRYPNSNEGFLTITQTKLEDKTNFSKIAHDLKLYKFFLISRQMEANNNRTNERLLEDCFEAFFGALAESNGFEPCYLFLINLIETYMDIADKLYYDANYKAKLLEYFHKEFKQTAKYVMVHCEGQFNKKTYIMAVLKPTFDEHEFNTCQNKEKRESMCMSYGKGKKKVMGEQAAAKMALINHDQLEDDQYCDDDNFNFNWSSIVQNEEEGS